MQSALCVERGSQRFVGSLKGDLEGIADHCVLGPRGGRYAIEATGVGSGAPSRC